MSSETLSTSSPGALARARQFYVDVLAELRKVTWPTREEAQKATIAIIVFVGILGLMIGVMDRIFQWLLVELVAQIF